MTTCSHCGRPVWDAEGPITIAVCTGWKSDRCELVRQNNVMTVLLANVIRDPSNEHLLQEAKTYIGEHVKKDLVDHRCKKCFAPYVRDTGGRIRVHFAKTTDSKPCDGKVAIQ